MATRNVSIGRLRVLMRRLVDRCLRIWQARLIGGDSIQLLRRCGCLSPFLYWARNAVERMFCLLKDFRRIATRYDKRADNFLAAIHIAALIAYWL